MPLESGDFRWATTLHEVRDFLARNRALSESNPLLPFEVRCEPCRKALVAVDPNGQRYGCRGGSPGRFPIPGHFLDRLEVLDRQTRKRVSTGRRRAWHRLERAGRNADRLLGLEGSPVDPDRTVGADDDCEVDVLAVAAQALDTSESTFGRKSPPSHLPAGGAGPQGAPDGAGERLFSSHFESFRDMPTATCR